MPAIAPDAVAVHAAQSFGNTLGLAIFFMPQRTLGCDQTFIHRDRLGIHNVFCNRLLPLQPNRHFKQIMRATIPIKVRAAGRKRLESQPRLHVHPVREQESILGGSDPSVVPIALFLFENVLFHRK